MLKDRVRLSTLIGIVIGVLLTSTMVLRTTESVFNGTTPTPTNTFGTGTVSLTNSSVATAVFTDNNLNGGATVTRCVEVTYNGSITASGIRLYGTASGSLAGSLILTVEQGTGTVGANAACSSFTTQSTIFGSSGTATFADFGSQTGNAYPTGVGTWTGVSAGDKRVYRFSVTVANSAAQNVNASGIFTWEAQG